MFFKCWLVNQRWMVKFWQAFWFTHRNFIIYSARNANLKWTSARSECTTNIWQTSTSTIDDMPRYTCSCCINFHFQILKVCLTRETVAQDLPSFFQPWPQQKILPFRNHLLVIFMKLFQLLLQGHSSAREVGNTLGSEIWKFVLCHGQVFGSSVHPWFWEKNPGIWEWEIMWKIPSILQNQGNSKILELDKHAWDSEAQLLDFTEYLIWRHIPTCSRFLAASHRRQMPQISRPPSRIAGPRRRKCHIPVWCSRSWGTGVDWA